LSAPPAREGRLSDRVESGMAAWTVASKLAIRRNSRVALFFGGIGIATGALIANPHLLQVQLVPKKELPHFVATEQTPHFASFAELAHAVKPAVITVLARTTEADLASRAHGSPEGQRSIHRKDPVSSSPPTATQSHAIMSSRETRRLRFALTILGPNSRCRGPGHRGAGGRIQAGQHSKERRETFGIDADQVRRHLQNL
jgi:hypothetical protein